MQAVNNRRARRLVLLGLALLFVMTTAGPSRADSGPAPAADPYGLLETINTRLQDGRIQDAEETLVQLKQLIATSPGWDPDGTFDRRLLPDLEKRINHLRWAAKELTHLYHQEWEDKTIPDAVINSGDVRRYLNWTTETVFRLRTRREEIINQLDGEEKAILYEASAYRRIQLVLETGVVQRAHEFTREVVKRIGEEDEQIRALRTRLDNLKRDTIDLVAQRERLVQELHTSREKIEQYLNALAAMVTEGIGPSSDAEFPEVQRVDEVFSGLLSGRMESMQAATSQTSEEKRDRQEAITRYRHYNRVLVRAQVTSDQDASIEALENLVADLPVQDIKPPATGETAAATLGGRQILLGMGTLLALIVGVAWLWSWRDPGRTGNSARDQAVDLCATDDSTAVIDDEEPRESSTSAP